MKYRFRSILSPKKLLFLKKLYYFNLVLKVFDLTSP
jgi:hypothetical protein